MKKVELFILAVISLVALATRLYGVGNPVADWHSWRQSDTAAVARNFGKFGFDPLRPRFDDLSNIPSGKDNPMGFRMVEFPLYQSVAFGVSKILPGVSLDVILRLVTITASVGTLIVLYLIIASTIGQLVAIVSSLVYAIIPFGVYYGRVILPDPFMVFWAVLSVYLVMIATDRKEDTSHSAYNVEIITKSEKSAWSKKAWGFIVLASVAAAVALLAKPMAVFLLLPVPYLIYRRYGFSFSSLARLFVYTSLCILPFWSWRQWILQYPEGIAVYTWLFNEGNIRFKGAWFYWLFAKRLGDLILGYWGLIPLGLGFLVLPSKKEGWLFRFWIIGAILYLVVVARGNVQHDYYQILLLPIIAVYVGKGLVFLLQNKVFSRFISLQLFAVSFLMMLAFSWYTIRTYYWINRQEIVDAGKVADQMLPKDAKVIASYNGDTTFLYQINRQGWPIGFDIDKKIAMGATHYVTISPKDDDFETRELIEKYTVLVRNGTFAIIDLTKPQKK